MSRREGGKKATREGGKEGRRERGKEAKRQGARRKGYLLVLGEGPFEEGGIAL